MSIIDDYNRHDDWEEIHERLNDPDAYPAQNQHEQASCLHNDALAVLHGLEADFKSIAYHLRNTPCHKTVIDMLYMLQTRLYALDIHHHLERDDTAIMPPVTIDELPY